jgi:hypothetical protein
VKNRLSALDSKDGIFTLEWAEYLRRELPGNRAPSTIPVFIGVFPPRCGKTLQKTVFVNGA